MSNSNVSTPKQAVRRFWRAMIWLIGAAIVTAMVYELSERAQRAKLLARGAPAPVFTAERFGGGTLELQALRGKVVMLDFWATWCTPCIEEMPSLVSLARDLGPKGLVLVAANGDDPAVAATNISAFIRKVPGLEASVVYASAQMSSSYRVDVLPTMYFIDREGRIAAAEVGFQGESALRRRLEQLLQE